MRIKQRIKLRITNIFIRKIQKKNNGEAMLMLTRTFMRYGQRRIGFIPEVSDVIQSVLESHLTKLQSKGSMVK